jgi:hypothetical protein
MDFYCSTRVRKENKELNWQCIEYVRKWLLNKIKWVAGVQVSSRSLACYARGSPGFHLLPLKNWKINAPGVQVVPISLILKDVIKERWLRRDPRKWGMRPLWDLGKGATERGNRDPETGVKVELPRNSWRFMWLSSKREEGRCQRGERGKGGPWHPYPVQGALEWKMITDSRLNTFQPCVEKGLSGGLGEVDQAVWSLSWSEMAAEVWRRW